MDKLICPSCHKQFCGLNNLTSLEARACQCCGDKYTIMYVSGFTDGINAANNKEGCGYSPNKPQPAICELAEREVTPNCEFLRNEIKCLADDCSTNNRRVL